MEHNLPEASNTSTQSPGTQGPSGQQGEPGALQAAPGRPASGGVVLVLLRAIDCGRYKLRPLTGIEALAQSIDEVGLQNPVVLVPNGEGRYLVVCGHRRFAAYEKLKREAIPARILGGLSEEQLFLIAVAENESREDFSDADRAVVILEWKRRHGDVKKICERLRLGPRQAQNLVRVAEAMEKFPSIDRAVRDPLSNFKTTHALRLHEAMQKAQSQGGKEVDPAEWVPRVRDGKLSVRELKRALDPEAARGGRANRAVAIDAVMALRLALETLPCDSLDQDTRQGVRELLQRAVTRLDSQETRVRPKSAAARGADPDPLERIGGCCREVLKGALGDEQATQRVPPAVLP